MKENNLTLDYNKKYVVSAKYLRNAPPTLTMKCYRC